jgi:hypothetical protein
MTLLEKTFALSAVAVLALGCFVTAHSCAKAANPAPAPAAAPDVQLEPAPLPAAVSPAADPSPATLT